MFAPRTRRVLLYLALAAGVMISAGRGAEPAATSRDAELTLQAREALQSDPELRALNLGVEVRAGTATLWGSVARPEQARSAEEALLRIPGVASVRNDCHAGPVRDPLLERVADLVKRLPSLVPEDVPPLVALPPHPAFPSEGNAPPGGRVTTHFHGKPISPEPPPPPPVAETVRLRKSGPSPALKVSGDEPPVALLPPLTAGRESRALPVVPVATAEGLPADSAVLGRRGGTPDLTALLEEVRASDRRFRRVNFRLHEGVVYLSGRVPRPSDIWELADRIAELPAVRRVAVEEVDSP